MVQPLTQTINAGNNSTVFTTEAFKTVSTITVGGGNTTGAVAAGIGTVLEGAYNAAQAGTYTIKATDIPVSTGAAPLVLNLTSPGVTAVFDYGETFQAVSREFLVDDDKISTLTSGSNVTGDLALVGGTTASFSSPHHITITGATNESSNYFLIKGATASSATDQEWVQGKNSAGTVVSTKAFKTVTSITVVNGNSSTTNATSAGKLKAGVTDENKEYTVTVFATQDSTDELNPHNVAIKHAIYQNDSPAQAYIGAIADKTIAVQDVNAPVAADNTVQTSKNTAYTFKTADFGYSDADGDAMTKIKITELPASVSSGATPKLNTSNVSVNDEITVANISNLKFTPATDAGGSGYGNFKFKVHDGLSYSANAATLKVNVGDSVQTTIKYFAQNTTGTAANQLIKNATIIMKDSGGNAVYAGAYTTNSSGVVDFTGVTDGSYTMSYTVTDSVKDQAINALDVSEVLDISSGLNTSPTNKQKVLSDTNNDGQINALDVSNVLDMSSGLDNGVATVALRDAAQSNPFTTKTIAITAGNNMNFDAYLIGDLDGSYANVLAAG